MNKSALLSILGFVLLQTVALAGGSSFCTKSSNGVFVAQNIDWSDSNGFMFMNPRGVRKRSLTFPPGEKSTEWIAKFRSVTVSQFGKDCPWCGMNERGLVVQADILDETPYPKADDRLRFNEFQWVQYQLDNFATAEEVVQNCQKLQIQPVFMNVHYYVCDKSGIGCSIEFLDGELVVSGKSFSESDSFEHASALTNSSYSDSVLFASRFQNNAEDVPNGTASLARFVRLIQRVQQQPLKSDFDKDVAFCFSTLDSVKTSLTIWQIVFDNQRLRIHMRSSFANEEKVSGEKVILFSEFESAQRQQMLDVSQELSRLSHFVPYDAEVSKKMLMKRLEDYFKGSGEKILEKLMEYQ